MGDIYDETVALIKSLGDLTPHGRVLAASAKELALEADDPPLTVQGQRPRTQYINTLRATLAELVEKGRASDDDEGEDDGDWISSASAAGATPIRNTEEPGSADARARGRKGRRQAR